MATRRTSSGSARPPAPQAQAPEIAPEPAPVPVTIEHAPLPGSGVQRARPAFLARAETQPANPQATVEDDFGEGFGSKPPIAVVKINGKAFGFRYRGGEKWINESFVDVVIVRVQKRKGKQLYIGGYDQRQEGGRRPDCMSVDGRYPDPRSPKLQNPQCEGCKQNRFYQTERGNEMPCGDRKRISMVFAHDVTNEMFGGPMLLNLSFMNAKELRLYIEELAQQGTRIHEVVTRISYDPRENYTQLVFENLGYLNEQQYETVMAWREHEHTLRMLGEDHNDGPVESVELDYPDDRDQVQNPDPHRGQAQPAPWQEQGRQEQAPLPGSGVQQAPAQQARPAQAPQFAPGPVAQAPVGNGQAPRAPAAPPPARAMGPTFTVSPNLPPAQGQASPARDIRTAHGFEPSAELMARLQASGGQPT